MVWLPAVRALVLSVATPARRATGRPLATPSIENWTVPVGVPPGPLTVAVKVSASPKVEGLALSVSVMTVALAAALTTWVQVVALLRVKFGSPL